MGKAWSVCRVLDGVNRVGTGKGAKSNLELFMADQKSGYRAGTVFAGTEGTKSVYSRLLKLLNRPTSKLLNHIGHPADVSPDGMVQRRQ